jgi:hypothetical protein
MTGQGDGERRSTAGKLSGRERFTDSTSYSQCGVALWPASVVTSMVTLAPRRYERTRNHD